MFIQCTSFEAIFFKLLLSTSSAYINSHSLFYFTAVYVNKYFLNLENIYQKVVDFTILYIHSKCNPYEEVTETFKV